jgi:AcrR family transcriptional regulator
MRMGATRAGCSASAIYRYLKAKDERFHALTDERMQLLKARDPCNQPSDDHAGTA